ncbi:MAG: putative dehydrogenase-like protein [bacterium]|nr:MAG: putative dehydrogenase-like protein [bacterium]
MLKVAVIGVGYLGRHHARIYANMPGIDLVGVCDSNIERGQAIAKEYNTRFYSNYRELFGKIDAASLAVPTIDHCLIGCELLKNKVSVLIEKPIAHTLSEADKLISTAQANNVCLQIGHLERFNPAVVAVSKVVTTPRFFETHRMSLFSPRSLDIDVVMDLMVHDLDIISWLVKSPVINISAVGIPVISPKFDIANARLEFANGCVANVTASRISSEKTRKLRLFQPGVYISLDYVTQQAAICSLLPPKTAIGQPVIEAGLLPVVTDEPLRAELAAFVASVKHSQPPLVTGQDGRNALALALDVSEKIAEHAKKVGLL